ncbi:MAG: sigma-70 family RNA polymerase sigma factor [Krumholzibacteria bacterium]|nr:sigma-70 family RNA polymerase sigma factor [Candidatus Krumholzibacteria bacterium]
MHLSHESPQGSLPQGSDEFFALVYDELRSIAHARLRGERPGYTLQATELVHEAYLRLAPQGDAAWECRGQFFAAAAEAMRRILIERARARSRIKRGGDANGRPALRVPLDLVELADLADAGEPEIILALDAAIERLAVRDGRVAKVVKLRYYAGLEVTEVAEALGASARTVLRDWAFARAWLFAELSRE